MARSHECSSSRPHTTRRRLRLQDQRPAPALARRSRTQPRVRPNTTPAPVPELLWPRAWRGCRRSAAAAPGSRAVRRRHAARPSHAVARREGGRGPAESAGARLHHDAYAEVCRRRRRAADVAGLVAGVARPRDGALTHQRAASVGRHAPAGAVRGCLTPARWTSAHRPLNAPPPPLAVVTHDGSRQLPDVPQRCELVAAGGARCWRRPTAWSARFRLPHARAFAAPLWPGLRHGITAARAPKLGGGGLLAAAFFAAAFGRGLLAVVLRGRLRRGGLLGRLLAAAASSAYRMSPTAAGWASSPSLRGVRRSSCPRAWRFAAQPAFALVAAAASAIPDGLRRASAAAWLRSLRLDRVQRQRGGARRRAFRRRRHRARRRRSARSARRRPAAAREAGFARPRRRLGSSSPSARPARGFVDRHAVHAAGLDGFIARRTPPAIRVATAGAARA